MKVSVIVPVYNTENYLRKCLDSLVNQTLKDIEIIVVNDGSTDNSQEIIDEYSKLNKNVKSYKKENGGLSDARNFGMKYAKGEYIGFVDSDDYIELDMYEKMYKLAKQNDSDLITCDFKWIYPDKEVIDHQDESIDKEGLMLSIRVVACNKLIKREILTKNKIEFKKGLRYEDVLFTYMILPNIDKISYLAEPLYNYIQRKDSISNNQTEKVRDIFVIFDEIEKYYKKHDIYEQNKEIIEYLHIRYFLGSSFLRIIKVEDKKLRKSILNENWDILNKEYPTWKKNKYLLSLPGKKNLYYRHVNRFIYKLSSIIFRLR